MNMLRC